MRTVFKKIGLPSLWVFALLAAYPHAINSANAQTTAPAPVTPPAATGSKDTISNLANSALGVAPVTPPGAIASVPPIAAPTPPAVDTADNDKDDKSKGVTLEEEESNVPKSVKAIIHHLDKESENITLSDLNSARQAIAKVETLIELEKKLSELEKVQKERQEKSAANAMPASMLMPVAVAPPPQDVPRFIPPPTPMMSDVDIDRIIGGAGEYKAVIKTPDGSTKMVSVGDTLPDGAVVSKISGSGMEVAHGDTKQTIHVKNVDMVFGVSP